MQMKGVCRQARSLTLSALAAMGMAYALAGAPAAVAAESCSNEQIRVQQSAERLPNCRAYEQLTPKVKNGVGWGSGVGNNVFSEGANMALSADGSRLLASGVTAFPAEDIGTNSTNASFVLERTPMGWAPVYVSPAYRRVPYGLSPSDQSPAVIGQSRDLSLLSLSAAGSFSEQDADGSVADNYAVRLSRSGVQDGGVSVLSTPQLLSCPDSPAPPCTAAAGTRSPSAGRLSTVSDDGSVVLFETSEAMGVAGASGAQVYARTGPSLNDVSWISRPMDTVGPGATQVSGTPSVMATNTQGTTYVAAVPNSSPLAWDNALTPDGSRVFFASPATGAARIYLRKADGTTVEVSRVRGGGTTASAVAFRGASTDGRRALVQTRQPLLPATGSTAALTSPNATNDLYLWSDHPGGDDAADTLVRVTGFTQVGDGPRLEGKTALSVAGQADDLSTFYMVAKNTHSSGLPSGAAYAQQVHVFRVDVDATNPAASTARFVATAAIASMGDNTAGIGGCLNANAKAVTCARASGDGRYLVFDSALPLTDDDAEPGCAIGSGGTLTPGAVRPVGDPVTAPAACMSDVYRYDSVTESLIRVSRGNDAAHDNGAFDSALRITSKPAVRVLEDGTVFFASTEPLVEDDVNGKQDVYEWSPDGATSGQLALLSSGRGPHHSQLVTATDDGRSVVFVTTDGLAVDDTDTTSDIYAAVREGGFRVTAPPVCADESCQPPTGELPPPFTTGTSVFVGPGNVHSPRGGAPAKLAVIKPKTVSGSTVALRVRVPGSGRLRVSGAGLASARRMTSKSAIYRVRVRLTPRAARTLRRARQVTTIAKVSFTPRSGKPTTKRVKVKFRLPANQRASRRVASRPVQAMNGDGR